MLSIRSFARSAPRAVSRLMRTANQRPIRQTSLLQTFCKPLSSRFGAAFSTTVIRQEKEGAVDDELVSKLESEIEMEEEMKDADEMPTSVKDFIENGPFEIHDTPGHEEVVLTRKFGDENIRITFNISDLHNVDPESGYEDRAIGDEEELDGQNMNQGQSAIDSASPAEGEQDDATAEETEESYPARVNIVVEKAGKGALAVETVVQDGAMIIDNVYHYTDASHALAKTAEKVHERQDMYVGPPFGNLDEDLQVLLEKYLSERGVDTNLALFVPDYIDMKEQKEYLRWLSNVKSFVES